MGVNRTVDERDAEYSLRVDSASSPPRAFGHKLPIAQ